MLNDDQNTSQKQPAGYQSVGEVVPSNPLPATCDSEVGDLVQEQTPVGPATTPVPATSLVVEERQRDMGIQPLTQLMQQYSLKPHDLVAGSTEQITHKMVSRALKGRWLTRNTMMKIVRAFNQAAGQQKKRQDLFNY